MPSVLFGMSVISFTIKKEFFISLEDLYLLQGIFPPKQLWTSIVYGAVNETH
jgi:hypothetical protein